MNNGEKVLKDKYGNTIKENKRRKKEIELYGLESAGIPNTTDEKLISLLKTKKKGDNHVN